jgi:hypothetical protein
MRIAGFCLCVLGVLFVLAGLMMPTTAGYSDTLNILLLNDQTNRILMGGFSFVGGVVLIAADAIREAVRRHP